MSLRDCSLGRLYYRGLEKAVLPWIKNRGITPNRVTFAGLIFAVMVPLGFSAHAFWGLLLIMLAGIADTADGLLARDTGLKSDFGAFLDSTLDRISDTFFLMGFWVLFWLDGRWVLEATILFFLVIISIYLISYVKARAEAAGLDGDTGIMTRPVRVVYLLVWAFLLMVFPGTAEALLWIGLSVFLIACTFTAGQRIVYIRDQFSFRI
ncbi:CDP-alcohol phosphatidyltransferase family protein [Desulfonatronospira sp.]|uniref:CDP-alcohol phosphatidyltransferase family protein n=1 Tax=Desulfonatronospira sp. TaxID=1962951 RepID=UPI0025C0B7F6|nr:CDP-alcohol phosphatidyltransferase family protein [Desulfonatronospira sp.]